MMIKKKTLTQKEGKNINEGMNLRRFEINEESKEKLLIS